MRGLRTRIASAKPRHRDARRRVCRQRMFAAPKRRPRPASRGFRRMHCISRRFVRGSIAIEHRTAHASNRQFVTCRAASSIPGVQIFLKSGSEQDIRHEMARRSPPCDSRMRGAVVTASGTGTTCSVCMRRRRYEDQRVPSARPQPAAYDNVRSRTAAQCSGSRATLGVTQ